MDFEYISIASQIEENIDNGTYAINNSIPSERELCSIFSVSRSTIRHAIDDLVSRKILIKKPGKGTYVKSVPKNEFKKTGNLLFLRYIHSYSESTPSLKDDVFYPKVLSGIEIAATKRNYHCIVKTLNENHIDFSLIESIKGKIDGIICGELHSVIFLNNLLKFNLPIVLVSPSINVNNVDIVEIDNFGGAYTATKKLIDKRHDKIAFIGGSSGSIPSDSRQKGYLQALSDSGIKANLNWIKNSNWCQVDGYSIIKSLLNEPNRPTAVFAASDLLAFGVFNGVSDFGLKVPEDLSIIGFDGIDMIRLMKPSLVTMKVRTQGIGETAFRLLYEQIEKVRDFPVKISIPVEYLEGESVSDLGSDIKGKLSD